MQALGGDGAAISTVNLAEVVAKLRDIGTPEQTITRVLTALLARGLEVVAFDQQLAIAAGFLRPITRAMGLSLGDRACLVLGKLRSQTVLTGDREWLNLDRSLGISVRLIRP